MHQALVRMQERKNIGKIILEPYLDDSNRNAVTNSKSSDTSGPDDNETNEVENN